MVIKLKKFGTTLTIRQFCKEAYNAFKPSLDEVTESEIIEVDFEDVEVFSPSWGDEFLTPLAEKYKERLKLKKSNNSSVIATLQMLEEVGGYKFNMVD